MNLTQLFRGSPAYLIIGIIFLSMGIMDIVEGDFKKNILYTSIYLIVGLMLIIGGVAALKKGRNDKKKYK